MTINRIRLRKLISLSCKSLDLLIASQGVSVTHTSLAPLSLY